MKPFYKLLFIALLISLVETLANGQVSVANIQEFSKEKVYVHLDRTIIVAGETLQYKVYTSNSGSKILYFMLLSRGNSPALQWRINLQQGSTTGKYQIPADTEPGYYELCAYTNRMRSGSFDYIYRQPVLIESLIKNLADTLYVPATPVAQYKQPAGRNLPETGQDAPAIAVRIAKTIYKPGETVEIDVSALNLKPDETADLSLSAKEQAPIKGILRERTIAEQFLLFSEQGGLSKPEASTTNESAPCKTPLENKGYMLVGHVSDATDNSVSSQGITLSVADSNSTQILFARSDNTGRFTFYLDRFYDNKELIFQVADQKVVNPKKWVIESKIMERPKTGIDKYLLRDEESAWLKEKKDFSLIEAIYRTPASSPPPDLQLLILNQFNPPDNLVYPADYAELVNFREIAENILPTVRYTMRNKAYTVQVYIPSSDTWYENDMILLNGVPFADLTYLSTLGTKDIAKIEVITRSFLLGDITFPGILSVYTHDGKIPPNYLKNHCYTWKNEVSQSNHDAGYPNATTSNSSAAHIPDFRSVLDWSPGIKIHGNSKQTVKFTASQMTGLYNIVVCGLSSGGYPLHSSVTFEVK